MAKRSITIAGHRTSVSLEDEFWQALSDISAESNSSLAARIEQIDRTRPVDTNLSAAIRLYVLGWYRERAESRATD
jgi:predicted DNA-binding ribbon-helix-helix protein